MRKDPLCNNQYYHIFDRSIAKYIIFNNNEDYLRFIELIDFYRFSDFQYKYSSFLALTDEFKAQYISSLKHTSSKLVEIVSYSVMPTHFHLILKQLTDNGISKYMANILNSYTRYFNIHHSRKGPLYEGKFNSVLVETNDQMLHLSRYQHLNAVTAGLVKKPEDWNYSSYSEYLGESLYNEICDFKDIIDLTPSRYKKFTNDQIDYQKKLSVIKYLIFEDYRG